MTLTAENTLQFPAVTVYQENGSDAALWKTIYSCSDVGILIVLSKQLKILLSAVPTL